MSIDGIRVSDDVFGALQTSVAAAHDQLRSTADAAAQAADAVGYAPLAGRLHTFSGNWSIHRDKLVAALDQLERQIVQTGDGLHAADEEGKREADELRESWHFPTPAVGGSTGAAPAGGSAAGGPASSGSASDASSTSDAAVGGAALAGAAMVGRLATTGANAASASASASASSAGTDQDAATGTAATTADGMLGSVLPPSGQITDAAGVPVATPLPDGQVVAAAGPAVPDALTGAGDLPSPLPADPGTGTSGDGGDLGDGSAAAGGAGGAGGGLGGGLGGGASGGGLPSLGGPSSVPSLGDWSTGHHGHLAGHGTSSELDDLSPSSAIGSVADAVGSSVAGAGHAVAAHADAAGGVMGGAAMGGMAAMGAGGAGRAQDPSRGLSDDDRVRRARAALESLRRESDETEAEERS